MRTEPACWVLAVPALQWLVPATLLRLRISPVRKRRVQSVRDRASTVYRRECEMGWSEGLRHTAVWQPTRSLVRTAQPCSRLWSFDHLVVHRYLVFCGFCCGDLWQLEAGG